MKLLAAAALALSFALVGCAESAEPSADASVFTASNTATAKVDGMTCMSCAGTICSAIEGIDGVQAVAADPTTGEVKIAIKQGATLDAEAVKKAVTDAKFEFKTLTLPAVEGDAPDDDAKDAPADGGKA